MDSLQLKILFYRPFDPVNFRGKKDIEGRRLGNGTGCEEMKLFVT